MEMILHDIDLPMRHTFTIAYVSKDVTHNLVVELRENGKSGFGEGSANAFYGVSREKMRADLEAVRSLVEKDPIDDPVTFWSRMESYFRQDRFAHCALDQAAHDLWGKRLGKPVWDLWGLNLTNLPLSDYTIGIDSIEKMVFKMNEFAGWPIYKIKLGTKQDIEIVRELRKHTDAIFRIDANTAWTANETIANSHELKKLGVEFLEQPMPALTAENIDEQRRVFRESALPIIADESCVVEEDVERCIGVYHGINIKLTKAGGLTPARRMIDKARQHGMQVMVGCMSESSVGLSAIAQLLPLIDYVDMDSTQLLAKDVANGVKLDKGCPILPKENGLGLTWIGNG
jgi:L-alanine-DL-glutamate epimerase-like enolase superfamily enzyme